MTDIAIRCEGLSKRYKIGEQERYKALRDVITDAAASPFRRLRSVIGSGNGSSIRNPKSELRNSFWPLDDVSFEVKRGEVVGIIGRNGAGKSTLLKILSRITKPTKGHATIHGRVGSLLEVGTGFHPELTGRENIYLNAAILGMRRAEVERKFDEIVAFAEVEEFIDTPVKRYSSGRYLRLAFALAVHLEPELLLVDEVLAVGDAEFQKKCLGKMGEVAKEGRDVLLELVNRGKQFALNFLDQEWQVRLLKTDAGRGHAMVVNVWRNVFVMRKAARKRRLPRMLKRIIPNNLFALIVNFVAVFENPPRLKINQFPHIQNNLTVPDDLAFEFCER